MKLCQRSCIVLTVLLVSLGCGGGSDEALFRPLHMHVLCPAAQGVTACPEVGAAFDRWRQEGLHTPQSTFVVWAVGPDQPPAPLVSICIPDSWDAPVMAQKADFIAAAREALRGSRTPSAVPPHCAPPGAHTPGGHRLQVSTALSAAPPAVWQRLAVLPEAQRPLHLAVLCDRSASLGGQRICTATELLRLYDAWLADSGAVPGASFSVYVVGPARKPVEHLMSATVSAQSMGERVAILLQERGRLPQKLSTAPADVASALAEALAVVVRELRQRQGHYQVVFVSDMLQFTEGEMNFEKGVPTSQAFLAWLRRKQLLLDLRGVAVQSCGDQHPDPVLRQRAQEAWTAALHTMQVAATPRFAPTCELTLAAASPDTPPKAAESPDQSRDIAANRALTAATQHQENAPPAPPRRQTALPPAGPTFLSVRELNDAYKRNKLRFEHGRNVPMYFYGTVADVDQFRSQNTEVNEIIRRGFPDRDDPEPYLFIDMKGYPQKIRCTFEPHDKDNREKLFWIHKGDEVYVSGYYGGVRRIEFPSFEERMFFACNVMDRNGRS